MLVFYDMGTASSPQSQYERNRDQSTGLLDELAMAVRPASRAQSAGGRDLIKEFVGQVLAGEMHPGQDVEVMINVRIASIDSLVSRQLNPILHAPQFRALEATWRGLDYLVRRTEKLNSVKIQVFNASKKEITKDLNQAPEFRTAAIASQVWETALETYGGEPFSALISNFSFGPDPEDQNLLDHFRRLGSWAHVPFIGTAAPQFLGVKSFTDIPPEFALQRLFNSPEYSRWMSLRARADAAYVALVLPSVLMRRPYSRETCPGGERYCFEERCDDGALPWGSAVWALAAQLGRSFSNTSWCADLHALEENAVLGKLPSFEEYDEGQVARRGPTDSFLSDESQAALNRLGFVTLRASGEDGRATFFETPTIHQRPAPDEFDEDPFPPPPLDQLEYVLASSRVSQYVKCIIREKQSSWKSISEAEQYLNDWGARYVVPEGALPGSPESRRPFLAVSFRIVRQSRLYYDFRVEGELLPNLRHAASQSPMPLNVYVGLPSTLPMTLEPAFPVPGSAPESKAAFAAPVSFDSTARSLERIGELHRQRLLDDSEFQQLRDLAVARMKESFPAPPAPKTAPASLDPPVPFAALHARIVERVAEPYQSGENAKYRAYRALADMGASQALDAGDSEPLSKLIDATLSEGSPGVRASTTEELDRRLAEVKDISAAIAVREGSSAAARAIAETAEQSVERANGQIRGDESLTRSANVLERAWRTLVWPDIEGAFSGGAAAASVAPAFASSLANVPMPVVAALGVVIGAGIRSGVAFGESHERNRKPRAAHQS
jgi:type VI secretion system protein ImpC